MTASKISVQLESITGLAHFFRILSCKTPRIDGSVHNELLVSMYLNKVDTHIGVHSSTGEVRIDHPVLDGVKYFFS